jgi:hypothetical protein
VSGPAVAERESPDPLASPLAAEPSEAKREFLDFLIAIAWESTLRRLREKNDNSP